MGVNKMGIGELASCCRNDDLLSLKSVDRSLGFEEKILSLLHTR